MCGILFTNKQINDLQYVIQYLKQRGPDLTSHINYNDFEFVHCLLSMTGKFMTQPIIDAKNKIVAMLNGEIYNYHDFDDIKVEATISSETGELVLTSSDAECIIPCYLKYGEDFIKKFDGEFAILLCDFTLGLLYVSTDTFSCKPLWISLENKCIGVSSYKSCLERLEFKNIVQLIANTTMIIDINTMIVKKIIKITNFDLVQYKTNFDDFIMAFENAIKKRTRDIKHKIFIGLSSGYDSGTIACALNRLGIAYTAYSIIGSEDEEIIDKRKENIANLIKFKLSKEDFIKSREYLKKICEEYKLNIDNGELETMEMYYNKRLELTNKLKNIDNPKKIALIDQEIKKLEVQIYSLKNTLHFRKNDQVLTDDNGSIGMSYICNIARNNKEIIYLSGSGADEVFSDYGFKGVKHYGHSTIGGDFPENLKEVFPWKNFFNNTQRAYLMKEEYVTGCYGIEGRYPFLDRTVVQEFLWLSTDLKNKIYKAPLHYYMTIHNFPFKLNNKVGFNCGFNGPSKNPSENYLEKISPPSEIGKLRKGGKIVCYNNINKFEEICYLDNDRMQHIDGNCYFYNIETNNLGDISGLLSPYILYENDVPLKYPHSISNDIILKGLGRYCHWTSTSLYFSSSDNTSPITNKKIYKLVYNNV